MMVALVEGYVEETALFRTVFDKSRQDGSEGLVSSLRVFIDDWQVFTLGSKYDSMAVAFTQSFVDYCFSAATRAALEKETERARKFAAVGILADSWREPGLRLAAALEDCALVVLIGASMGMLQ
jgi:hypothetical protein